MPDMKGPIAYALSYPERLPDVSPRLDLASIGTLTFEDPDLERFPCLGFAFEALKAGGSMPAVVSAANEVAVKHFLEERIGYGDIAAVIRRTMEAHTRGGSSRPWRTRSRRTSGRGRKRKRSLRKCTCTASSRGIAGHKRNAE